ncbi:MAG: hypothetical protein WBZ37_27545 [Mycobacterium sp.]
MSDKGLLKMDLACPEGHVAGHLVRQVEHHPIEIDLPDTTPEEWPRGGDKLYTHLTCQGCNRRIYGSTQAIQEKATWLSESESESQGRHSLRYIEDSLM